jgi:RNA polymerase sigma-70 factor (ECF subfamily)
VGSRLAEITSSSGGVNFTPNRPGRGSCDINESDEPTGSAPDSRFVADALRQLAPGHRTVIIRAYYVRRSIAELAEELDVPPGTVSSRLYSDLHALRRALQER